ncbi:hypothetical protein C5B94_04030 [Clavibacter michiganensis]|nr:hypothetical protein C5B94_04030 [Clavibacter michiganensis]
MTARVVRGFAALFNLIAEPRVTRVIQFVIYVLMTVAGARVLLAPPLSFEGVLGTFFVYVFGGFVLVGGLLGGVAVLPGIWWLERSGLIALFTGLVIYAIVTISLGSSIVGTVVCLAFALTFVQRWRDIRGSALAPKGR